MWPTLTKAEVARDLYLEIEAGSSGRPNQAQELQNFERLAPILMQLPGIKPAFLVKQAIKRLDDKVDVDEAIADGLPSITSMNGGKMPGMPGPGRSERAGAAGRPQRAGAAGAQQPGAEPPPPRRRRPGSRRRQRSQSSQMLQYKPNRPVSAALTAQRI